MNKKTILFSFISFFIGLLLMEYATRIFFVGMFILFVLIAFQTPSTKPDPTGESNDASIRLLRLTGLNAILYLVGGYFSAIFL